jgi:tetratricopeptide (TPR) repeat protein
VLKDLLRRRPDVGHNYAPYGQLLQELGDRPGALAAMTKGVAILREAVRLRPDDADAHMALGAALAFRGDVAKATSVLRTAIQPRPDVAKTRCNLGLALLGRTGPAPRPGSRLAPGRAEDLVQDPRCGPVRGTRCGAQGPGALEDRSRPGGPA